MSITLVSALRRLVIAAALVALAIAATALHISAQAEGRPVRVVVLDSLPVANARALVLHEGRGVQPITIFLTPASANPEMLGGALALARKLRAKPLPANRTVLVPISGIVRRGTIAPGAERRLTNILRRLENRPRARIGNVGPGRWIETTTR